MEAATFLFSHLRSQKFTTWSQGSLHKSGLGMKDHWIRGLGFVACKNPKGYLEFWSSAALGRCFNWVVSAQAGSMTRVDA